MQIVSVNQLVKTYQGAPEPSVKGLSFTQAAGTILGLLGPNGSGKTTTISTLCGLLRPDSGEVLIDGKPVQAHLDEIKRMIGVVPQSIALFPQLSAIENLQYFGNLYGLRGKALQNKIEEFLIAFGLEKSGHKEVFKFSGGMKRRANIIAAILHDPKLLVLDEPTAGVDVQSRSLILHFLKEYNATGRSILYTSHLLEEAQSLCDEVLIIDEGRFIASGKPADLIRQYQTSNLEEVFLQLTGHSVRD